MTDLAENLARMMAGGNDKPKIAIRWKPFMWWAYFNGGDTSHFHSDDADELERCCRHIWPDAEITIELYDPPA